MTNLGWLIWMEAAYHHYHQDRQMPDGTWIRPYRLSRLAWFNMLYGPHVGEH